MNKNDREIVQICKLYLARGPTSSFPYIWRSHWVERFQTAVDKVTPALCLFRAILSTFAMKRN